MTQRNGSRLPRSQTHIQLLPRHRGDGLVSATRCGPPPSRLVALAVSSSSTQHTAASVGVSLFPFSFGRSHVRMRLLVPRLVLRENCVLGFPCIRLP